ncbi:hypothetical protein M8445_17335 (plasmid) [Deinococcus aquaticus]|uniref:Uncharacterized protein n=1 Tax=Deinococcus aquaticus TaxID=328692 RepID=A0ABY7V8R0_9DEIO|nr:hypothetical protein [Deinococcus aquaticus]WDA60731.1 hypothetical protein M8445_17335 [Deinococcus aquaticus]
MPAPLPGQPERVGLAVLGGVIVAHVASAHSAALFEAGWQARTEEQRRNQPGTLRQWRRGWDHANTYLAHLVTAQVRWPVSA